MDGANANSESFSQLPQRHTWTQVANFFHVVLSEFGLMVAFAGEAASSGMPKPCPESMKHILRGGNPFQVGNYIVRLIAITVIDLLSWLWRPKKSQRRQAVNGGAVSYTVHAKRNRRVITCRVGPERNSFAGSGADWGDSFDTPGVRDFVEALEPNRRQPSFHNDIIPDSVGTGKAVSGAIRAAAAAVLAKMGGPLIP